MEPLALIIKGIIELSKKDVVERIESESNTISIQSIASEPQGIELQIRKSKDDVAAFVTFIKNGTSHSLDIHKSILFDILKRTNLLDQKLNMKLDILFNDKKISIKDGKLIIEEQKCTQLIASDIKKLFPNFVNICCQMEEITSNNNEFSYQENGCLINILGKYEFKIKMYNDKCYYQISFINQSGEVIYKTEKELRNLNETYFVNPDINQEIFDIYKNSFELQFTITESNKRNLIKQIIVWMDQLKMKNNEYEQIINSLYRRQSEIEDISKKFENKEITDDELIFRVQQIETYEVNSEEIGAKLKLLKSEINELENKLSTDDVKKIKKEFERK